jgi:D-galactarolactone isomerase
MHVFPDPGRYPYVTERPVTPPVVTLDDYRRVMRALGLSRVVLVQSTVYGYDNRACADACAALGAQGRMVAVMPTEQLQPHVLAQMHAEGCRGLRINLWHKAVHDSGTLMVEQATRIADFGWHLQLFAAPGTIAALLPSLRKLPVDVVLDHFGMVAAGTDRDGPGAGAIRSLLASGKCWVKLSAPYRLDPADGYPGMRPWVECLAADNPSRLLWGSDWPHPDALGPEVSDGPQASSAMPDTAGTLDALAGWGVDEPVIRAILVENPAALYGFDT